MSFGLKLLLQLSACKNSDYLRGLKSSKKGLVVEANDFSDLRRFFQLDTKYKLELLCWIVRLDLPIFKAGEKKRIIFIKAKVDDLIFKL